MPKEEAKKDDKSKDTRSEKKPTKRKKLKKTTNVKIKSKDSADKINTIAKTYSKTKKLEIPETTSVRPPSKKTLKSKKLDFIEEEFKDKEYFYGTGKRKSAIARVRLYDTPGDVKVNGKELIDYFNVQNWVQDAVVPLTKLNVFGKVTIRSQAYGGGIHGQSQAVALGIARALIKLNDSHRAKLRKENLLTRDSRVKESKKYGLKRARKAQQYTKR